MNSAIFSLLLLAAKVFLVVFPFIISLIPISFAIISILYILNRFIRVNRLLVFVFIPLSSIAYLYMYAFLGAYFKEIQNYYAATYDTYWMMHVVCYLGVLFITNSFYKELLTTQRELSELTNLEPITQNINTPYPTQELMLMAKIYIFKGIWMLPISYIMFFIFPTWVDFLFGDLPKTVAMLWL